MADVVYGLGRDLLRLQPVVILAGGVYAKTRGQDGPASLVTALGAEHRLRRLCSQRVLMEHRHRVSRRAARELLEANVHELCAARWSDPLTYFLRMVVPAVWASDWGGFARTGGPHRVTDLAAAVEERAKALPLPELPAPSLWVLGRVWMLSERAVTPGGVSVCLGGRRLGLTGDVMSVQDLAAKWRGCVQEFVDQAGAELVDMVSSSPGLAGLSAANLELSRQGHIQSGDLLLLAGTPARLGYVLPPHHNTALGRLVDGDVAITSAFEVPPAVNDLCVYQRLEGGRWEPVDRLPSGICLGDGAPQFDQAAPGLSVATYLRWAAGRIAMNGKFHA